MHGMCMKVRGQPWAHVVRHLLFYIIHQVLCHVGVLALPASEDPPSLITALCHHIKLFKWVLENPNAGPHT